MPRSVIWRSEYRCVSSVLWPSRRLLKRRNCKWTVANHHRRWWPLAQIIATVTVVTDIAIVISMDPNNPYNKRYPVWTIFVQQKCEQFFEWFCFSFCFSFSSRQSTIWFLQYAAECWLTRLFTSRPTVSRSSI